MTASPLTNQLPRNPAQDLTPAERRSLAVFRQFLMDPGQMLCFYGPQHDRHRAALRKLISRDLVVEERFRGAYSLTRAGFAGMNACAGD